MAESDSLPSANTKVDHDLLSEELILMKKEITKDVTKTVLSHLMGALKTTQESIVKDLDDIRVHKGIYCDSCDQIIRGVRFKCGNCSDYDLCETCESIPDVHEGNHIFLKIRNPMPQQSKPKRRRKKMPKSVQVSSGDVTSDLDATKNTLCKLTIEQLKLNAQFLHDVTIPDGYCVAPGVQFLKAWKVMNSGNLPWTPETFVNYISGSDALQPQTRKLEVPRLLPGEEGVVSVVFRAPVIPGSYQSHWGFVQKDEETFGDRIWCMINVMPSGNGVQTPVEIEDSTDLALDGEVQENGLKQNGENVNHVAEVLSAVHEVQERGGEVVSRKLAASSYTATPNNTPFDLSPPKSPEPQESNCKNINFGSVDFSSRKENSNVGESGRESDDKSGAASSSDSDAEFVIIPMPKCFSFDDTPTEILHRTTLDKEIQVAVHDYVQVKFDVTTLETEIDCGQNVVELIEDVPVSEEQGSVSVETTVKLIEISPSEENIIADVTVNCSSPSFDILSMQHSEELEILEPNPNEVVGESQALESENRNPTFSNIDLHNTLEDSTPSNNEQRTIQVLPEGLVTGALSAAASVYNTARAVLSSMQVRMDQDTETAEVQEPVRTPVPPSMASMDPMQQLIDMGFCNRTKNEQLLRKHNGDLVLVVAELVNMNDNDWYASRHTAASGMPDFD